jgi:Family of unknown function (DUF5317)
VLASVCVVLFYVGAIAIVALVVALTRGSFRRLGRIELRHVWILLLALAIQVVLEVVTFAPDQIDNIGFGLLMLSYLLILAFCVLNLRTSGFILIAVGVALNALVIGLNQGMPTKDNVVERHGKTVHIPIDTSVKHKPSNDDDMLPFLGDQITLPGSPNDQFSIGDIVILLGVIEVCFEASRRPRRYGVYLDKPSVTTPK